LETAWRGELARTMFQVRIHGRGGQGVVTAAEILSIAAFREGREAQAFPSFGAERMGAPVLAFCRIDDRPIRTREPVTAPDTVVVQDPTLLRGGGGLFGGLNPDGYVLINVDAPTTGEALLLRASMCGLPAGHVATVAASQIAQRHVGRPLPNAALLGALIALTGVVGMPALCAAIRDKFPGHTGEMNAAAAAEAFADVRQRVPAPAAAVAALT
jgi:pyruvate ferredoxin oxidoreductase gamma subunit